MVSSCTDEIQEIIGTRTIAMATIAVWASAVGLAQPRRPVSRLTGSVLYRMTLLRRRALAVRRPASPRCPGGRAIRAGCGASLRRRPVGLPAARAGPRNRGSVAARSHRPFPGAVAWQEDELVRGPAFDCADFLSAGLYHFEMFDAVPASWTNWCAARHGERILAAVGRPAI